MSVTDVSVAVKDTSTAANIPVDGVLVNTAGPNPGAGQAIRQTVAIGDGEGDMNTAMVDAIGQLYVVMADFTAKLTDVLNFMQTPPWVDQAGRLRSVLELIGTVTLPAVTTVTTVTTVATVTNQSQTGGYDVKQTQTFALDDIDFQLAVRGRVSP